MIVRQATEEDVGDIAAVHRRSIRELCKAHYSPEQLDAWTAALQTGAYSKLLNTHELLVAEDDGELLGFCVLDSSEGLLNATYVSPTASRRGVGRSLVMAAEAVARTKGLSQIRLNATLNAVRFYQNLGYARGDLASNRLPTGVELPCVTMSKALA